MQKYPIGLGPIAPDLKIIIYKWEKKVKKLKPFENRNGIVLCSYKKFGKGVTSVDSGKKCEYKKCE